MASIRKKQDEKNLKILRELVSLPGNKHCFDCNQRGPTYVNMTIGSFVCTKCSGMIRGLTPPHRVKSISMASFTAEEVDLVKSRGNDLCRRTWLALYDQNSGTNADSTKDEQQIKDFMIDKYERKRFYHDKGLRNGPSPAPPPTSSTVPTPVPVPPIPSIPNLPKIRGQINGSSNNNNSSSNNARSGFVSNKRQEMDFVADFGKADIFSAQPFGGGGCFGTGGSGGNAQTQPSFANFDNNVIFNSADITAAPSSSSSSSSSLSASLSVPMAPVTNGINGNGPLSSSPMNKIPVPPSEDRYAALKDLDMALKNQQQMQQQQQEQNLEWSTNASSNGSGYASPLYGSPSTTGGGSIYGSPPQGGFGSNPFSAPNHSPWISNGNTNGIGNGILLANNNNNNMNINMATNGNGNGNRNGNGNGTVIANNCFPAATTAVTTTTFPGSVNTNPNLNLNPNLNPNPNPFRTEKFNGLSNGFHTGGIFGSPSSHFAASHQPWTAPNPFALGVAPTSGGASSNNPFL